MLLRFLAVLLMLCISGAGQAQEKPAQVHSDLSAVKPFMALYYNYANVLRERGEAGLREIAAPDFTVTENHKDLSGKKAFAEIGKIFDGTTYREIDVSVGRIEITGNEASVITRQKFTFDLDFSVKDKKADTPSNASAYMIYDVRHTWRKTAHGWKLERWERLEEKDWNRDTRIMKDSYIISFTVHSPQSEKE